MKKVKRKTTKKLSIEDRIKPVESIDGGVTALFYGRSGTGKTTLAATFPTPLLIIDIKERGTDSISDVEDVSVFTVNNWDDFEDLYSYLEDNPDEYKTIVIDALHTLQDTCIEKVLKDDNKEWGQQVTIKNYGQVGNLMKKWLLSYRDLRDLGINVVLLAHDRVIESDEDDEDSQIIPEVGPRLTPSVSGFVMGSVNLIGNTFIREETEKKGLKKRVKVEYCLRLGPNKFYSTKIRSPKKVKVPSYMVDADYDKLVKIIKGETEDKPKKVRKSKSTK